MGLNFDTHPNGGRDGNEINQGPGVQDAFMLGLGFRVSGAPAFLRLIWGFPKIGDKNIAP